tara:strand:- start:3414 stop:4175 length:762 start_codon:yes stop_codon:yes gene_type:complete
MKRINNNEFPTCGKVGLNEKVCAEQWGVSTLSSFTYGLLISLMILHTLYGDVIKRDITYPYWIVVHISVLTFSYLQKNKNFNFSLDSDASYTPTNVWIISVIGMLFWYIIVCNMIFKKISYDYLLLYGVIYTFVLISFWLRTHEIRFHIHHSLLCTVVSYFVKDWSCKLNEYIHAVLFGITIQGLNFYNLEEFQMFYISYDIYPNVFHIILWYITMIVTPSVILWYTRRRIHEDVSVSSSSELLAPIPENDVV